MKRHVQNVVLGTRSKTELRKYADVVVFNRREQEVCPARSVNS
jgi:hypothetical protein